jgi:DNA-binding IclR family transcriptional regulator
MPLGEIAKGTAMAPSKLRFYLVSFMQLGLVTQDPLSGRYSLGPHAIKLGLAALQQFDVVNGSRPALHRLAEDLGYSTFLAVWGSHGPTIVSRVDGRNKTVLEIRVGSVLPLVNSAIGRVFLSYMPQSATEPLVRAQAETLSERKRLARIVVKIVSSTTRDGLGVARGTLLTGFTAIASPIIDHAGWPVAAMSVIGRIGSLDDCASGKPARLLKTITSQLSEQIGVASTHAKPGTPTSNNVCGKRAA